MGLDRFRQHKASPDYTYLSLVLALVLLGLVMISSSSVVVAMETYGRTYAYVIRQSQALVLGIIGLIVASQIPYTKWKDWAKPLFVITVILLIVVFIPGVGKVAKGAARWIDVGFLRLQPSEIAKLAYIFFLSAWLQKQGDKIKHFQTGLLPFLCLITPAVVILMLQRDLGTLMIILITSGLMFFVAGASYGQIGVGFLVAGVVLLLLIAVAPYRMQRLTTYLNPGNDKLGTGYHINQSLITIGSGGMWGRGFGNSLQKHLYLPEPQTDSIFAVTVEELGFVRSSLILLVIAALGYRGYQIAFRTTDLFGRMVAFGIASWFLFQAIVNISAIMGLIPLTGVPLPFISYGGTSLILSLSAVGVLLNISRNRYGAAG